MKICHLDYVIIYNNGQTKFVVQICRKHKLSEATAYLLEKAGDVHGAFGIMLDVRNMFCIYS